MDGLKYFGRKGQSETGFLKIVLWVLFFLVAVAVVATWIFKMIN